MCTLFKLTGQADAGDNEAKLMTKLSPEWVRTSDPVIRSPARYRWTTAPAVSTPDAHVPLAWLSQQTQLNKTSGTIYMVEIDWDQPGEILSPGCPHHPCSSIPGTRRLPVLSPIKKYGWWNKNGCCHLYCGSGHFHNIKIIVNGSNMTPFHWN